MFALLAAVILSTQISLQVLPGVQLNGLFIAAITLTYRFRALIPLYVYILLYCLYYGFYWSIPYLYIWLPLWGMFMLAGKLKLPKKVCLPIYMVLCGLYGLSFGVLYAPYQAIVMGWGFDITVKWIVSGFITADITHGINNFVMGILIIPLSELLKKLNNSSFP